MACSDCDYCKPHPTGAFGCLHPACQVMNEDENGIVSFLSPLVEAYDGAPPEWCPRNGDSD